MIVVIADDITGAAELAGIGHRHGLKVMVSGDVDPLEVPELLVIYTNSRSMKKDEAVDLMEDLTKKAAALKPALFYKKTDSVLRGHVVAELKAHMKVLKLNKSLLVPVNPSIGRTISNGHYYVGNEPAHQTGFASDPEFPVQSSDVKKMLGDNNVILLQPGGILPDAGNIVGEASTDADIKVWAGYCTAAVLFAGGASFFRALLKASGVEETEQESSDFTPPSPMLFVSGTTYRKSIERLRSQQSVVSWMPGAIYSADRINATDISSWSKEVLDVVSKKGMAMMAIGEHEVKGNAGHLREVLTETVRTVVKEAGIRELVVEGGSTAFSIIEKLQWFSFVPTQELQQGVVRMRLKGPGNIHLTIKPGSYDWPALWRFN